MTANNTQNQWRVDPVHSQVQFKVKHLAVSNVSGTFNVFNGQVLAAGDDFDGARVSLQIDAGSIDTNHAERDGHLRSEIFFDTERFPEIIFAGILHSSGDAYALTGNLTIHGVQQPITLAAEFTGKGKGRFGDVRAGFELSGKLNRKDFGLSFNMLTETGGLLLGEEIKLHFDVQLIREEAASAD